MLAICIYSCYTPRMFIKTTRSGGHSYVQLVESYRNEDGKPRQRTVATLGRLEQMDIHGRPLLPSAFLLFWIPGIDCCHTSGL